MAQRDRPRHALAAQVEVAIAQAHLLAHLAGEALDLEGRRLGVRDQGRVANAQLELAGRQLGVDGLGIAPDDRPGDRQHVLGPQPVRELERVARVLRMEDELDEPGAVAQVDEHEAAVVAAAVDPAGQPGVGVDPVAEHLAAPGVAVLVRAQRRGRWSVTHRGAVCHRPRGRGRAPWIDQLPPSRGAPCRARPKGAPGRGANQAGPGARGRGANRAGLAPGPWHHPARARAATSPGRAPPPHWAEFSTPMGVDSAHGAGGARRAAAHAAGLAAPRAPGTARRR